MRLCSPAPPGSPFGSVLHCIWAIQVTRHAHGYVSSSHLILSVSLSETTSLPSPPLVVACGGWNRLSHPPHRVWFCRRGGYQWGFWVTVTRAAARSCHSRSPCPSPADNAYWASVMIPPYTSRVGIRYGATCPTPPGRVQGNAFLPSLSHGGALVLWENEQHARAEGNVRSSEAV